MIILYEKGEKYFRATFTIKEFKVIVGDNFFVRKKKSVKTFYIICILTIFIIA